MAGHGSAKCARSNIGALAARQRAWGIAPRRSADLDYSAAANQARGCDRFFDQIADQPHSVARIVLLDNAAIHKGEDMEKHRRRWARQGMHLYYLPPYSPELSRIEILWKHAKYLWRRFAAVNGTDLLYEIQSLMKGFKREFTVNFV